MLHTKDSNPYTSHMSAKTAAALILTCLCILGAIGAAWMYTHRLMPLQRAADERAQQESAAKEQAQRAADEKRIQKLKAASDQYRQALKDPSAYFGHDFDVTKLSYALVDITGDHIPEMFIKAEHEKAMSEIHIFSSRGEEADMVATDTPLYEGHASVGGDDTTFQIGREPKEILQNEYPYNSQSITSTEYKLVKGKLIRKQQWTYAKNNVPKQLSQDRWRPSSDITFTSASDTSLLDNMVKSED